MYVVTTQVIETKLNEFINIILANQIYILYSIVFNRIGSQLKLVFHSYYNRPQER